MRPTRSAWPPGGIISTTGVGGLTLGGGIGYLTRGVGLSIDNLLSADVVLADGRQVTASDYQHEDLFWALRGGGGNFGVVTSFEFQLHEVGDIVGGPMFYEVDDAAAVLACYGEFIADAPEQLGCFFGWQIAPPCRLSPRTASRISSARWSSAGTATRGGRQGTPATARRGRSESAAGRGDAVPGPQQRLRRPRPEGHAALLEGRLRHRAHRRGDRGSHHAREADPARELVDASQSDQRRGSACRRQRDRLRTPGQELRRRLWASGPTPPTTRPTSSG